MTTETTAAVPSGETAPVRSSDEIALAEIDRSRLQTFVHLGHESARARIRAQVLLKLGRGLEPGRDLPGVRRLSQHRPQRPRPLR